MRKGNGYHGKMLRVNLIDGERIDPDQFQQANAAYYQMAG